MTKTKKHLLASISMIVLLWSQTNIAIANDETLNISTSPQASCKLSIGGNLSFSNINFFQEPQFITSTINPLCSVGIHYTIVANQGENENIYAQNNDARRRLSDGNNNFIGYDFFENDETDYFRERLTHSKIGIGETQTIIVGAKLNKADIENLTGGYGNHFVDNIKLTLVLLESNEAY